MQAAAHVQALRALLPRLRDDPTFAARLRRAATVPPLTATERSDWRWLCSLLGAEEGSSSAPARDDSASGACHFITGSPVMAQEAPRKQPHALPLELPTLSSSTPPLLAALFPPQFAELPPPCIRHVLRLLPASALGNTCCTSRRMRNIAYGAEPPIDAVGMPVWTWQGVTGRVSHGSDDLFRGTLLLDDSIDTMGPSLVASLGARRIASIAFGPRAIDLDDALLACVVRSCGTNLRRLALDECECLTDAIAPQLACLPALESLSLAGCEGFSEAAVADMLRGVACRLTALDLSYLSTAEAALQMLFSTSNGAAACDAAVPGSAAPLLGCLHSLSLSCTPTSDRLLAALGTHTPVLTSLNLSSCLQLSDPPIAELLASLPALTSCDLSYLPVSDEGTVRALSLLPRLALVNLEGCPLVTEHGLSQLARTLQHLRYANVSGCDIDTGIGDFTPRGDRPPGGDADIAQPLLTPRSTPQYLVAPRASRLVLSEPAA